MYSVTKYPSQYGMEQVYSCLVLRSRTSFFLSEPKFECSGSGSFQKTRKKSKTNFKISKPQTIKPAQQHCLCWTLTSLFNKKRKWSITNFAKFKHYPWLGSRQRGLEHHKGDRAAGCGAGLPLPLLQLHGQRDQVGLGPACLYFSYSYMGN